MPSLFWIVILHSLSVEMATLAVTFSGVAVVVTVTGATVSTLVRAVYDPGDAVAGDLLSIVKNAQFWSTSTGRMKRKVNFFVKARNLPNYSQCLALPYVTTATSNRTSLTKNTFISPGNIAHWP